MRTLDPHDNMYFHVFLIILCDVSYMCKVPEYILSDPSILVHASLYGLHVSGLGSEDPVHLRRLY